MITWISFIGFIGLMTSISAASDDYSTQTEIALFSGGCFWCEAEVFNHLPGVISVESGYTGGHVANPTYEQVSRENTGHKESVKVIFDPSKITYDQLLEIYWHNIDPFDANGQFCDKGDSYKAFIFYTSPTQKQKAEATKQKLEVNFQKPIATEIQAASTFYPAEDYHQDYAHKNPLRYKFYRYSCGRDKRLTEVWRGK
jgi:peptide-methionine (S)-S-oxide reductase